MIIEKTVREYLDEQLTEPVCMERRGEGSGSYVMVEKVGGGKSDHINSVRIAVQSYAESMYKASELNERVKAAMENIGELASISGVRLETDYNFTDSNRAEYRYQAVFLLYHY